MCVYIYIYMYVCMRKLLGWLRLGWLKLRPTRKRGTRTIVPLGVSAPAAVADKVPLSVSVPGGLLS